MINRLARAGSASRGLGRAGRLAALLSAALATALAPAVTAEAQGRSYSLIRDAEIEDTIRAYVDPIFTAAGLDAQAIKVHLIQDDRINAFVAPGMNMFVNTGLLMRADTPNQVIGVLAHETGHIEGGHLVRLREELRNATIQSIIGLLVGIGAGVASGDAGVGAGAATIGQGVAQRNLLQYSRNQEASADQAGMKLLDDTHQSSRGLLEFFQKLEGQEFLLSTNQDPYLRTHPLTTDRIEAVQDHVDHSPYSNAKDSPDLIVLHQRMLAKLKGFLWPLDRVLHDYPPSDLSAPARYARAIALFRVSRQKEALALMDSLLKEAPDDPFYLEQKGQILFLNGRIAEALPLYQRASDLRPREALLRREVGQVQIETEDPRYVKAAVANLEFAARIEGNDPDVWQLLAIAYGRDQQYGMSALAQAEQAMAAGNREEGRLQARRALKMLPSGSSGWLRANDIVAASRGPNDEGGDGETDQP